MDRSSESTSNVRSAYLSAIIMMACSWESALGWMFTVVTAEFLGMTASIFSNPSASK